MANEDGDQVRVVATLREIADAHQIGVEAARTKARRRAAKGEWRILENNHPSDPIRVDMPATDFQRSPPIGDDGAPPSSAINDPRSGSSAPLQHGSTVIEAMTEIVTTLTNRVADLTDRLVSAERDRAEALQDAALANGEVRHLQEKIEIAMNAHRNTEAARTALEETITSEREANGYEIGRLSLKVEEAQAALAEFKLRPWWRRMAG